MKYNNKTSIVEVFFFTHNMIEKSDDFKCRLTPGGIFLEQYELAKAVAPKIVPDYSEEQRQDAMAVMLAKEGDLFAQEKIIQKYKRFVHSKTKTYFLIGADKEDIVQEGMIGLYKAIRDYDQEKKVSFRVFAEICITRQVITAIKSATRQKHIPLNSYVSLDKPIYDENTERTLLDMLASERVTNPEMLVIFKEEIDYIEEKVADNLSKLEKRVLREYLQGKSYQEISSIMGRPVKSIDNALQRVKKKLELYVDDRS